MADDNKQDGWYSLITQTIKLEIIREEERKGEATGTPTLLLGLVLKEIQERKQQLFKRLLGKQWP